MIRATTVFNRAGTAHLWTEAFMSSNPLMMRSLCGLFDTENNLDMKGGIKDCKRCEISNRTPK